MYEDMKNWFMNIFSGIIDRVMGRKGTDESPRLEYVKSRIDLFRPRFALVEDSFGLGRFIHRLTPNPILSRVCVVSLILMIVGTVNVWGATVTFNSTNSSFSGSAPYTISQDSIDFNLFIPNWYNDGSGNFFVWNMNDTAFIKWTPNTGFTIAITQVDLDGVNGTHTFWGVSYTAKSYMQSYSNGSYNTKTDIGQSTKRYTKSFKTSDSKNKVFPDGIALGNNDFLKVSSTTNNGDISENGDDEYKIYSVTLTYIVTPPAPTLRSVSSIARYQYIEGRFNNTLTLTDYFAPFSSGVAMSYVVKKKSGETYETILDGFTLTDNLFYTPNIGEYQIFATSNATGAYTVSASSDPLYVTIEEVQPLTVVPGTYSLYVDVGTTLSIDALNTTNPVVFTFEEDYFEYNSSTHVLTAKNDGNASFSTTTKSVHVTQESDGVIDDIDFNIDFTIKKYANTLYGDGVADYSSTMYMNATHDSILLSAINTFYTGTHASPISVRQLNMKNDSVTTVYNATTRKICVESSYYTGTMQFEISQPENYKYVAAKDTFSVEVKLQPEATDCYVLSDTEERSWSSQGNSGTYSFSIDEPGDKLIFDAQRTEICFAGICESNNTAWHIEYSTKLSPGDGDWTDLDDGAIECKNIGIYYTDFQYSLPSSARAVRFITDEAGSFGNKFIKNVHVTRKTWLTTDVDTVRIDKTEGHNPIYPSSDAGVGQFTMDWSMASGGALTITNDNGTKFTLSKTSITSSVNCASGEETISVSYTPDAAGNDTAHLVIYNTTYRKEVVLIGTTIKHDQDGSWKANIGLLQVDAVVSGLYTTNLQDDPSKVEYTILSGSDYVSMSEGTLTALAAGVARIQAYVEGDADYYDKYDTIDITVTDKDIQYIVWGEGMESTLRNLVTGESTVTIEASAQSDIDGCTTNGTRTVSFTSRNSSVVSVDGTTLTIVGKGKTWLIASQTGGIDGDGHDYYPVTDSLRVVVRAPGDMCEEDRVFEQAGETKLSHKDGDRYSSEFSFGGNEPGVYSVVYKGEKGNNNEPTGTVYVEQYVSGAWVGLGEGAIEEKSRYDTIRGQFNRTATKMRIRTNGKGHHYFKEIAVLRAEYTDMVESEVVKETLVFSSYIGTPQNKSVKVRWYSRKDLEMVLSEGAPFTITGELDRECRVETTDLTITYTPTVAESHGTYSLLFTDGIEDGFRHTVTLDATATAQVVTLSADADWAEGSWSPSSPNANKTAKIAANVTISTQVSVYGLTIEDGATVTITPTGGLTVGVGGISGASTTSLILETDDDTETPSSTLGQTGYLRISPDYVGDMPSATVKLFSKAYSNDEVYNWQYVGIPLGDDNVYGWDICTYGQQYIYGWNEEAGDWFDAFEERVYPFQGYCLTQENNSKGRTFTFTGTLAAPSSTLEPISLSYTSAMADGVKGYHVLANSFAAPIDISRFEVEDFVNADATIYLFNTGYYEKGGSGSIVDVDEWEKANAGQYIAIPVETANTVREVEASFPVVIPAMQGFCVQATGADATLKLDYNELVWKADYSKHPNKPMRVAAQKTEEQEETNESDLTDFIKVTLSDGEAADILYLLASESYDKSYENGYDAPKMMSDDPALPNIFAVEDDGQFAIDATSDIEGTFIGVRTGAASNYTIYFSHVNAETEWMLLDIQTNKTTRIANEASYSFSAKANSLLTNRFVIVEWDGNAGTATGTEETTIQNKIQKFIYNDQLFILKDGVLYDARGMVVRR